MKPAETYILNLNEPFRQIALEVKTILEFSNQQMELKFKYNLPFFYFNGKMFCYLNFSSKKNYLDICFFTSNKLEKFQHLLETANRKLVKSIRIYKASDFDGEIVQEIVAELIYK